MNIFILSSNVKRNAQYHCDKHVIKMILESAQMLCTVLNEQGFSTPYKSTHKNHPCVKWLKESYDNFAYLKKLAYFLNEEYKLRFNHVKNHKSYDVIASLPEPNLKSIGLTNHVLAMPDQYKNYNNAIESYRNYYIHEKSHIATWKTHKPSWYAL